MFSKMSINQIREMLMQEPINEVFQPYEEAYHLPSTFDSREKWPHKIHPIRDQKKCGSCWAFALTEVLSDRFDIVGCSKGVLSPQDLVSCDELDMGCNGGRFETSWKWAIEKGITTEECMPYTSGCGLTGSCSSKCKNGSVVIRHKADSYRQLHGSEIQEAIFTKGPVEFGMAVYIDFMFYRSGVYHHVVPLKMGYHAVKCIGWGVENNKPYWLCANSWGKGWGDRGFFKLLRGKNECSVEGNAFEGDVSCEK
ncbi:putative cathepsin B5 cysteine protease [Monocercomonoides exilis]|uniref:putative cathepsin B5 cysteine protease n=1 Tax=Monocercomonoides exilis TaxID=2049356 RepID=UPI00355A8B2A|nr:putative cathepsin B5 cysteine protease [Monocercomonoides exilis]|eukprot:MONOS_11882.1-p1 / transcript=MONOS_11882.1 / gene=MONOS_11882 / organism=Monocercomonoides_exilis_PA203 / gene_product=cathepsin B5 cysteine protease / transcript_product=cathepsin B5 cysteine protease / location=Mono_scaffold00621:28087-28845(+) / protein_length=252 / sequence_SO=supercontig / SO=protein_coding / is_pseudo=false